MLQQGQFVADLAYLLPEGAPSTMPFWGAGLQPELPKGYDYDFVNTDVLLNRMSVGADGRLVLQDGMSYRVLVLPPTELMTPAVLRKVHELVAAGATVVGQRAESSPSLVGFPKADDEVKALSADLWGGLDGVTNTQQAFGKGMVVWGLPLQDALAMVKAVPDFESSSTLDGSVVWIHRHLADADVYFVSNQKDAAQDVEARFRVSGKEAEIWHPASGEAEQASFAIADGRTTVPLHLEERESCLLCFVMRLLRLSAWLRLRWSGRWLLFRVRGRLRFLLILALLLRCGWRSLLRGPIARRRA